MTLGLDRVLDNGAVEVPLLLASYREQLSKGGVDLGDEAVEPLLRLLFHAYMKGVKAGSTEVAAQLIEQGHDVRMTYADSASRGS
jgi:hypothetical protein